MSVTREQFSGTTIAKSDQMNAADLLGGSLVCEIVDVEMTGSSDQPISIHVDSHPQPWKPSKTSRRVLLAIWPDTEPYEWIGRWIVLYNDPSVQWAGKAEGGIRMSHASHIDSEKVISVQVKRGKKEPQTVKPYRPQVQQQAQVVYWPYDKFQQQLSAARSKLESGELTADAFFARLQSKAPLTDAQIAEVNAIAPSDAPPMGDLPPDDDYL